MYARGILFGKMKYELGDHSYVRCPEHNLVADIEFKTKGYFGGTYNALGGVIRNISTGETLFELSGMWSGEMILRNVTVRNAAFVPGLSTHRSTRLMEEQTGHKEVLFDATNAKNTPPLVRPLEEQEDRESQKLWHPTVLALKDRNHDVATDEKTKVEDQQREEAARRLEQGVEWQPRLFRKIRGGPGGPEEGEEDLDWILNAEMLVTSAFFEIHKRILTMLVTALPLRLRSSRSLQSTQSLKGSLRLTLPVALHLSLSSQNGTLQIMGISLISVPQMQQLLLQKTCLRATMSYRNIRSSLQYYSNRFRRISGRLLYALIRKLTSWMNSLMLNPEMRISLYKHLPLYDQNALNNIS
jgi:hypothetical protein